ncbi:metallophosphoesterase [Zeaxanthinibacter sp. PT1]|uniref:metallophosphoesterase n=1 Tax=Zeaxanthinibacter TaxID=561554 RepID=UPI002348FA7E|nr:metallophosphoesterase [Zeaxanthinibacter sp. PT1]MDC6350459.1 metallophosphoesterase [Zeaxanthinibacter sp. PT1]
MLLTYILIGTYLIYLRNSNFGFINKFDLIGDIHGHADELQQLLLKLGYEKKDGVFAHEDRKAFFVGDYIDRGPKIPETLEIVRTMVE